jgi:hypothetical protein
VGGGFSILFSVFVVVLLGYLDNLLREDIGVD